MAVQINVAANQAALVASIQAGVQAYNQRFANNNQINLNINARAFSQPLGRITGDVKDFEAALAASNARVIAFGASTAVLGGVIRSFKELASVTIDVEKNLADINRVFGLTTSQLQKFSTDLFNVSKQTASSFDDASKAALEFSRQGLKAEDTLQRTKDALTLTRLAGISTANAVDALTSTVNGFAATGISTTQILNKLVAVEQDYAVGAGDLAEALSRTGQAAQEAGVSLDQLNALVTAAQQSTARGGAVIGNALKTIFTRLQRTETLDQLEAFNIAVRDVQGNILPAVTILQNFAGAYKNLADAQKAQLSEQVAGVYQVNILKAVVNDLNNAQGVYAGALQRGASATNEAEVATAKLNRTLDALLSQTATSAQQLANNIGKVTFEPLARYGTEQLKSLVESMNEILEGEGIGSTFANGLLKGIRNILAGPGAIAAFFTLFKLIQNSFSFLTQALPQIAGITTETQNRKNIEQSILQIMQQQGPISQALAGTMGNQAAQAQLLLQLARQQTAEYQQQSALAKQLAAQLAGQGVKVAGARGLQVTRAGGYVPTATKLAEVVGAKAGGYSPGRVVPSPVGGVMNTAEDVKYIPGFAQPFINPPANSKAGRAHRQNAISRTGVDPYMASGFIPNFVKGVDLGERGKEFEKLINFHLINEKTSAGSDLLDFALPSNALTKASFKDKNKISLNPLSFYGDAKIKSTKETQKDLIKKLVGSLDEITYGKLITRANKIKSNVINLNDFLPLKPSLISSKSSITKDNENASVESVLGFDVIEKLQRLMKNDATQRLTGDAWENKKLKLSFIDDYVTIPDFSNSGFIPNFAPPTSAIRIPWFKKFANPAYDNIQPTLGISKASDVDTFRQTQFRSTAKNADKQGDPNIFGPLYEAFGRRALQLVNQSNIFGELVAGSVLQPGAIRDQTAFDAGFLQKTGIVGVDYKGFPKINLSGGSVAKHMTDKYNRVVKTDPEQAAKIKEAIMIFNEPGNQNQLPSEFGKNFIQLAGTSYSEMLKNTPNFVKELSNETDMLLDRYVKNPAFLPMSAAKGFIPNFADFIETEIDAILQPISKSRTIQSKQLFGKTLDSAAIRYLNDTSIEKLNKYLEFDGYMEGALGIDFPDRADKKFLFTKNKGFIPNFAYIKSMIARVIPNTFRSLTDTKGTAFSNTNIGIARQKSFPSYNNLTDEQVLSQAEINYPNLIMSVLGNNAFIPDIDAVDKQSAGAQVYSAANIVSSFGRTTANKFDQYNPFGGGVYKGNPELIGTGSVQGKAIKLSYANVGKLGRRWENSKDPVVKDAWANLQKYAKMKLIYKARTSTGNDGSAFLNENSRRWYKDDIDKELRKYSEILKTEYNNYLKSINRIGTYVDIKGSAEAGLFGKDVNYMALRPDVLNKQLQGLPKFDWKNAANGIFYGDYKNNKAQYDRLAELKGKKWTYNNASKRMFLQSGGFIPNFAYKQSVMSLEESMSGNKAIFDTKPFPHIRNSSQPTFSSAIADHGGLSNALSDSIRGQKNAGLMSRGFLPNFGTAPQISEKQLLSAFPTGTVFSEKLQKVLSVLNKNLNELSFNTNLTAKEISILQRNTLKAANYIANAGVGAKAVSITQNALAESSKILNETQKQEIKNRRKERFDKFSTTLAIAGPLAAGLIEQAIFGNRDRTEMSKTERAAQSFVSTGLTSISTGVSLGGAVAGPIGAVIGGLGGLGVAVASAIGSMRLTSDELQNLADQTKSTTQSILSSGENYINAIKTIETSTDPEIIKKASYSLAESFKAITDINLQKQFREVGNDVTKLSKILSEYELSKKTISKLQEERSLIEKLKPTFFEGISSSKEEANQKKRAAILGTANPNEIDAALVSRFSAFFEQISRLNETQISDLQKVLIANRGDENIFYKTLIKFADQQNQAVFTPDIANQLAESLAQMQTTGSFLAPSAGITSRIPADLGFYSRMFARQTATPNQPTPEQIQASAMETSQYKDLIRQSILEKDFQMQATELMQQRKDIYAAHLQFIEKNLSSQRGFLSSELNAAKVNVANRTAISREKLQIGITQNYLELFKNAPGVNREYLKEQFIEQNLNSQMAFIKELPDNLLDFTEQLQEYAGKTIDVKDIQALYEATQKFKLEEKNILDMNQKSLQFEQEKYLLAVQRLQKEQSFLFNLKSAYIGLADDGKQLTAQLGRNLPRMFGDGLVDGIKAAIKESDNLADSLMSIAARFLDEISTTLMRSGIYQILGGIGFQLNPTPKMSFGAEQKGGLIRAQNGMYISGSGSGDKYPALLENGEYVLNRNAVMAMGGPAALDALNFSAAPRFATGGQFNKQFDTIAAMEANMTEMGLENSPLYKEMTDAAKQKAEEDRKKRFAAKQQRAAMIGSLVAAAATIAIGAGVSNISNNAQAKKAEALSSKLTSGAELTKSESMSIRGFIDKGLISPTGQYTGGIRQTGFRSFLSSPTSGPTWYQKAGNTLSKPFRRQIGGSIGSRLSDTIPGYMEGGLYNTPLIKKYSAGLQSGGSSLMAGGNSSSTVNNNTNATNSFNFNTTVQRDGTIKMGSNTTSYEQQDVELSKNLNNRIYAAVGEVIRKEKQFGGSLAAIRNS